MKHLTQRSHLAARRAVRGRGAAARAVSDPAFDPALTVRAPPPAPAPPCPALGPPGGCARGGRVHRPRDVGRGAGPPPRGALPGPSRPGPRGS